VNDELLILASSRDVREYLLYEEQAALTALDSLACLPLVADADLVAFVAFCDTTVRPELEEQRTLLQRCAQLAASRWRDAVRLERVRARSELLRRSQQLGVAGQMAASVAHEVRNPLAAVRSLVQFAREVELPIGEREAMLDDVLQEVDRIDRTLTNMLQLSQPTSADHGAVPVTELVEAVSRFVRGYALRRGVNVQLGTTTPALTVVADERELRQVVTNLLLNACQACEGSGSVTTSVTRVDDGVPWVEISVVDSGQGINSQDFDRVFEPFFTTRPQGTGLGLPFCRDAVERLGGRIAIQSVHGTGTTVQIRLPLLVTDAHDSGR
jgi:signal transduction histidine kinase